MKNSEAVENINVQELIEKYDTEARYRKYAGTMALVISVIAIAMSLFHLYTAGFGVLESLRQRAVHLLFVLTLTFLLYPATNKTSQRKLPTVFDFMWMLLGVFAVGYLLVEWEAITRRGMMLHTPDYIAGAIGIIAVFEAGRRVLGKGLTIIAVAFMLYSMFGDIIPGALGHREFSIQRVIEHMYWGMEGLYSIPLGVSATYIFLFILFGAFLQETGMTKFINELALSLAGRSPGGPAKVAVIASGIMGMITGSSVANAATIGSFTIPLMKKSGYKPHFAGAVEAVASTGGQIMPPIMGAAAFIMAEFLRIPYSRIMLAAIIPALLYYSAAWIIIHLEAKKSGIQGLPESEIPKFWPVLKNGFHLLIPIGVLIYLLVIGITPLFAAAWGIIATVLASLIRKETRISIRGILRALENGARGALSVAVACAVVGFVVGSISLTSLGLVIGNNVIGLAGDSLILAMIFTMFTCLVMGMGVPTTPMYIIVATVAAPILVKLGVFPLAAHMFVFFYGALAEVTPPVALAAYTAAGIAKVQPSKVAWTAVRLALAGFIIPYFFVFSPILLFEGGNYLQIIQAVVTSFFGVLALAVGLQGWMYGTANWVQRIMMFVAALLLITPGTKTDIIGAVLFLIVWVMQKMMVKKAAPGVDAAA